MTMTRRSCRILKRRKKEDKSPYPYPTDGGGKVGKRDVVEASMTEEEDDELKKKMNNTTTNSNTEEEEEEEEASSSSVTLIKPCSGLNPNVVMNKEQEQQQHKGRAIFILDNALLIKGLVRKKWKILFSEEDSDFLLKQKKNLNDYRPDIVYKALRKILDSPLNKAGMVGAVYVKIDQGLLFEIKPHVRIPRSLDRFCGIMLELLEKSCVRAKDTREKLIRVIEEPVTRHLPVNSRIIGLSPSSKKLVDFDDYISSATDDLNLVFVVGTTLHGKINKEYLDDFISVSNYPLGARFCLGMICNALERKWKVF